MPGQQRLFLRVSVSNEASKNVKTATLPYTFLIHSSNIDPYLTFVITRLTEHQAFWASFWIYNLTLTLSKIAIVVQYLRLLPVTRFRNACYGVLGLLVSCGAWGICSNIFLCHPVPYAWNKSIPGGGCMNQSVIWFTNAGMNIALDVLVFALLIYIIPDGRISRPQGIILIIMFVLGATATLLSCVRVHFIDVIANTADLPRDNVPLAILSVVEVNIAVISACMPVMRPLFALIIPKHFGLPGQNNATQPDIENTKNSLRSTAQKHSITRYERLSRTTESQPDIFRPFQTNPINASTRPKLISPLPIRATSLSPPATPRNPSILSLDPHPTVTDPLPTLQRPLPRITSGQSFHNISIHPSAPYNSMVPRPLRTHKRSSSDTSANRTPAPWRRPNTASSSRYSQDIPLNPLKMSPPTPVEPVEQAWVPIRFDRAENARGPQGGSGNVIGNVGTEGMRQQHDWGRRAQHRRQASEPVPFSKPLPITPLPV